MTTTTVTPRTPSHPWWAITIVAIVIIVVMVTLSRWATTAKKAAVIEKAATTQAQQETNSSATSSAPQVRGVVQLPDCTTPCQVDIQEVRDIYTDGHPIWMLPPGWPRNEAIRYSGTGHLIISGGNIHPGVWKFWADGNNAVLVRILSFQ